MLACATLAIIASACKGMDPFGSEKTLANGLVFDLVRDKADQKAQIGDFVTFNIVVLGDNTDTIFNSLQMGQPVQIQLTESKQTADLMTAFREMGAGDSAVFHLPADSIPNRPQNLANTKMVYYYVSMLDVKSKEALDAERKMEMDTRMQAMAGKVEAERPVLEEYLKTKNLSAQRTANGVYYVVTNPGNGQKPTPGQQVEVNYKGMLLDGKTFDSSDGRPPFKFVLGQGQVIPGWDEGIPMFSKGGKGLLIIPSALAYGDQSPSPEIPSNSPLVFEIELVDFGAPTGR